MADGEPQIDFAAEGLLDGLEGEERAERLALLEQLAAKACRSSELRRTTAPARSCSCRPSA
jgi:hypothetical protein